MGLKSLMTAVALAAGSAFAVQLPAVHDWNVPVLTGERVALKQVATDMIAIEYDLVPDIASRTGNRMRMVKDVDLLFKKPIDLKSGTERVFFDALGMMREHAHTSVVIIELHPIVRDADGERFYFLPKDRKAFKHGKTGWNAFMTAGFHSGEAGAASHGTCHVGGKVRNSFPDGKLELLGFRLHVARSGSGKEHTAPLKGKLYLASLAVAPLQIPFSEPFAYAGAFLKDKGTYTFAAQIKTQFQGVPVREFQKTIVYNPDDPIASRQKISLDLGPDDIYWITYQIVDERGNVIASDSLKYQQFGSGRNERLKPVDTKAAPVVGYMRINSDHPGRGVYLPGQPYDIKIRVFPKGKSGLSLQYKLLPYYGSDILLSGEKKLGGRAVQNLTLSFERNPQYNAFRLFVDILEKDTKVDSQEYVFGEKNDPPVRLTYPGRMTDRNELKKNSYNRLSYVMMKAKAKQKPMQFYIDDFREFIVENHEFVQHVTICPALNDFEILPGVFDYSLLDQMMNIAADYGCKITVRFAHSDLHHGYYRWGKFSRQLSADSIEPGDGISYGAYAATDPGLLKFWADANHAVYKRYCEHTAFEGYFIMKPAGEWTVVDQPWDGTAAGYSPVTAASFRDYLKKRLHLSLAQLNKRWGITYKSYAEVMPPMPSFELGAAPDLSMKWLDFVRFKADIQKYAWVEPLIEDIRSYDDKRVIIVYGSPSENMHLAGKLDYCHNGGNHSLNRRGEYVEPWKKGKIGWITEPIHPHGWGANNDPGKGGWVLDVSTWTMLTQAGGGGANLHVYSYTGKPTPRRFGGFFAFDRYQRFIPILRELHDANLIMQPADVAVHQDRESLYTKHRTTFGARLEDLKRWLELLNEDAVPNANLSAFPDRSFKLVVPNILDEVISLKSLRRYEQLVKHDGAKMIISANTGKYVPELGTAPFQLLNSFGISLPDKDYVSTGHVSASALDGNPLFDAGRKIEFQTLTTMREQKASPEVRKAFWQYKYRWLPETDYFGYYPAQKPNGKILARFPDGGAALSLHTVGKGEVLVFWGTPDISSGKLKGMMTNAAAWAGVENKLKDSDVPNFTEMTNPAAKRHYGLFYLEDKHGAFKVKFPHCPDGDFFCDEMVGDFKFGRFSGKHLRENGLELEWKRGASPLKAVRIIPAKDATKEWVDMYNEK
jgi:hypothetical protein